MKTVGIIGFGSFGRFLAEKLDRHCRVIGYSKHGNAGKWTATFNEVSRADYVILAVPLDAYKVVLKQLQQAIGEKTTIVDVCSVKEKPVHLIKAFLPNQPLLALHPLFGPESATETLKGHTLVVCPDVSTSTNIAIVKTFAQKLGLHVIEMSAKDHDREMAIVQGLTFFIARSLKDLHLHKQKLSTPSFEKLLQLADLERHHSTELFYTIQTGNQYTQAVRQRFIEEAENLNKDIQEIPEYDR